MTLGDRIVIMKDGYVQQIGTPQEVFNHPANIFVAGFIGTPQMNFFDAVLNRSGDKYTVTVCGTEFEPSEDKQAALKANNAQPGPVTLGVRPEHIMLCSAGADPRHRREGRRQRDDGLLDTPALQRRRQGRRHGALHRRPAAEHAQGFRYGEEVHFSFGGGVMHVFDAESGKALH